MTTSSGTSLVFSPDDFVDTALRLVGEPSSKEAELRTAIGRAYYGVFLNARDTLFGLDQSRLTRNLRKKVLHNYRLSSGARKNKNDLGSHEMVIFAVQDQSKNIVLAQQLDQLREARVRADYKCHSNCLNDVGKSTWRDYAEETLELAIDLLPQVKALPSY